MVRNCSTFIRSAIASTTAASGRYSPSQARSRLNRVSRAARMSPGAGMSTVSRDWNTSEPNTRRIGCSKLSGVYCVSGADREIRNPTRAPAASRLTRNDAPETRRSMFDAVMNRKTSNPL